MEKVLIGVVAFTQAQALSKVKDTATVSASPQMLWKAMLLTRIRLRTSLEPF